MLAVAAIGLTAAVACARRAMSAHVDLDGDGAPEKVWIDGLTDTGEFVLHVNDLSAKGRLGDRSDGFYALDLDTHDKFREIAVHTSGPSDDFEHRIYWYDGKQIRLVGHLEDGLEVRGTGIVYERAWMGFWRRTDKYVLEPEPHTLKLVPQEYHYVGVTGRVVRSTPIYETQEAKAVVANLRVGSDASVILNAGEWYLVKSATDLLGWMREPEVYTSIVVPAAD